MPQTFRDRGTYQIAILVQDYPDNQESERAKEGDIVGIRRDDAPAVGLKENSNLLWMRIDGEDSSFIGRLADLNKEGVNRFDKRQYCIPLKRIKEIYPWVDLNRIRDPNDIYQPFMEVTEPETHEEIFAGLNTASFTTGKPGTFRIPIVEQLSLITSISITNLPPGYTWSEPFTTWENNARTLGNRVAEQMHGREKIRDERRDRNILGPLIEIRNGSNQLTDTTCDITIEGLLLGPGEYITKERPMDLEGLVFDKAKMEYI